MFPAFVASTAWGKLLYVVGLAMVLAATSIGRIRLENLALEGAATSALGQKQTLETHAHNVRFTPDSVAKLFLSLVIDRDSVVMRQTTVEAGDDGSAGAGLGSVFLRFSSRCGGAT